MRKQSKISKLSYLHQSSQSDRNKQSTGNLPEQFLLLLLWVFHAMQRLSCLQYCQGLPPLEASEQESWIFSICNRTTLLQESSMGMCGMTAKTSLKSQINLAIPLWLLDLWMLSLIQKAFSQTGAALQFNGLGKLEQSRRIKSFPLYTI